MSRKVKVWIAVQFQYERECLRHIDGKWRLSEGDWIPVAMRKVFASEDDVRSFYFAVEPEPESSGLAFVEVEVDLPEIIHDLDNGDLT